MASSTETPKPPLLNSLSGNIATSCLIIITVVLLLAVFKVAYAVIMPPLVAFLISMILEPPISWLVKKKVPRSIAIVIVLIVLVVAMYYLAVLLSVNAAGFIDQIPSLQKKFTIIIQDLFQHIPVQLNEQLDTQISKWLTQGFEALMALLGRILGSATTFLSTFLFIMIILAFILVAKPATQSNLQRAFKSSIAEQVGQIMNSIAGKISTFMLVQTIVSLATGLLVWMTCVLLGLKFALTWGMLAFFLNFIPFVGSIIAALPPVLLALLQFYPNIWPAVIILLAVLAINQIIGNVVTPKLMGDQLDLSPIVIFIFLLLWGFLWGIIGAFLAIIFAVMLKIICEHVPGLRPIAIMMTTGKRQS